MRGAKGILNFAFEKKKFNLFLKQKAQKKALFKVPFKIYL